MKKTLLFLALASAGFAATAQQLAPDQNPDYKQSLEKYRASQVSLQETMNTTVQDTYKAYDFSTARSERRAERREWNRNRSYYNDYGYYGNDYDSDPGYYYQPNYVQPYYSPYNYRFHNYRRRHW